MDEVKSAVEAFHRPTLSRSDDASDIPSMSPLSRTVTESSESTHTIRIGGGQAQSSEAQLSLPYPSPLKTDDMGTPTGTPGLHLPFTALSPTVPPATANPSKLAKDYITKEWVASANADQSIAPSKLLPGQSSEKISEESPDLFSIAIQIQTEPGLNGWWKQSIKILRETFLAERATLSIPSDSTEIENVPWAQLASFNADEDESVSQIAVDAGSTQGSIGEILAQDSPTGDKRLERDNTTNIRTSSFVGSSTLAGRPKLESRHSYGGYPTRNYAVNPENPTSATSFRRPRPSRTGSQASVGGAGRLRAAAELNAEQLRRFDHEHSYRGPLSDDTNPSSIILGGRILDVMQPLDAETDPLITPAGIVRVLNNSRATVLTRKYLSRREDERLTQGSSGAGSSDKKASPPQRVPAEQPSKSKLHVRQRSTNTSTRSSNGQTKHEGWTRIKGENGSYEDFEQVPGTPWAQSPAPSPAALADPEENPFFTNTSTVEEAFKKNPPSHEYGNGKQIEAIGLDKSCTILQVPLIHPSASLSQPKHAHRQREDRKSKTVKAAQGGSGHQALPERKRKVPLAILSILAPAVPYPSALVEALNRLSPVLATTFYAARQHTHLHNEVLGLSQRRARSGGRMLSREERPPEYGGARNLPGFSLVEPVREESFSPLSTSTASSDYLTATYQTPKTPLPVAEDRTSSSAPDSSSESGYERHPKQSPVSEKPEGYFPSNLSQEVSQEQSPPKRQPSLKGTSPASRVGTQKRGHVLHSQGATFHNTHPSLPTATAVPQSDHDASEADDTEIHPFKEPSLSLLRSMIDIGATQQFIAEPGSGKLLWVNSKFQAYRSTSSGQRLDDDLWDKIYPKDRKTFRKEWLNALETGDQLSQQLRLERFDGQYRWFHIKFLPLKDKFGLIKYWSGQAMDIHDLHEAEVKAAKSKEKAASEAKYRAIANSLPVIVFAASVPTGMTFANTQWLSYSGQTLEEALGFGFLNHVHPDDLVKCRFPGLGGSGVSSPRAGLAFDRKRDGIIRTYSTTSSTGESESTAVAGSKIDHRPNRPASPPSELQIPNELLRDLAEAGVILCAKDGQGNLSITTELRLKSKDDQYRWHLVQGSCIESVDFGQGEAQWFIACTDISVQKQNEAKIQKTNSALEHMNSALEAEMQRKMGYLSSMSHEIRTPLNGIIGNLQFLINSGLGESAGEWAHGAQEAAKGMHELINGILDLSKAEANMLKLDMHWFNPRHMMEEVTDILNSRTTEKKIEFCYESAADVPSSIRGDKGRIKQILVNLAGNAIKFTKFGEVIVKCDILDKLPPGVELPDLHAKELFIRWTVTDTGIGFSTEDKKLLFKAYSQVKSKSTRDIGGTGLGLLLCKTMVNLHGGEIDASSEGPGRGSAFTFFARFKVRKEELSVEHSRAGSSLPSPSLGGPTPIPSAATLSPGRRTDSPASMATVNTTSDSPALLSDSSSALSYHSGAYQRSIRSSASTMGSYSSDLSMKLTLPPSNITGIPRAEGAQTPPSPKPGVKKTSSKRTSAILTLPKAGPLSPKPASISAEATTTASTGATRPTITGETKIAVPKKLETSNDPERSSFRPPLLSVLVVCPPESTRRITSDRIRYVAPRSTPCNITSVEAAGAALDLLLGDETILFTHIVLRLTENDIVAQCLRKVLASPRHTQACILVVTDLDQQEELKTSLPDLDYDALNKSDRVKMIFKPVHAYKLAKVFDPFNENAKLIEDPKEAKRKEEKRLQKESYALFKRVLGGKSIRVLAVEDNALQMNVSFDLPLKFNPTKH